MMAVDRTGFSAIIIDMGFSSMKTELPTPFGIPKGIE